MIESRQNFGSVAVALLIALVINAAATSGQTQESYEGFVSGIRANAVKGEVFYQRGDAKFKLEAGLKLDVADSIFSGENSFAELLLQPGNYLRIGPDTQLQIIGDDPDKMRLKLNRGSISVEILSKDFVSMSRFYESLSQVYEFIRVITASSEVVITRPGIFRVNAPAGERTEVIVRDGEAVINGRRVKEKRAGVAVGEEVTIAEINSKLEDSFDSWGRGRASELIAANKLLKRASPWAKSRKEGQEMSVDVSEEDKETSNSRFVVSAKPGAINFVELGVEFSRPTKEWQAVTEKSQLETGDKLRTAAHTFAELTMLPDINLRVDGDSEILFEQLSNEAISLKLLKGAAILDVARFESKQLPPITLAAASTSVVIADDGNYRVDVEPAAGAITVRNGKVNFKERSVGSCKRIAGGAVSDCDKKRTDNFDFWSEHRGEGLLFAGRYVVSMVTHLDRVRRGRARTTGFWFQNPGRTDYTFVPYSFPYFRSPYGGNYSTVLSPRLVPMVRPEDRPYRRPQGPPAAMP